MERLRSFSFKPTRRLVFSFTIFSSIIFLSSFTIWVIKSSPSSLNVGGLKNSNNVQAFTGFVTRNSTGDEIPALIETHLGNFTVMQENAAHERVINKDRKIFGGLVRNIEVTDRERKEAKKMEDKIRKKIEQKTEKGCDLTKGSWVFDASYPLYTQDSCSFIDEGFDCVGNGRLNTNFSKWRWQPQGCDLPRYIYIYFQFKSFELFLF